MTPTEIRAYEAAVLGALRHEITHLVVHAYLPSMPMWIHEGLATGGYRRAEARTYARAKSLLESDDLLPFDRLVGIHAMGEAGVSVERHYLQSRMAVEFLILGHGGLERLHEFGLAVRSSYSRELERLKKSTPRGRKVVVFTQEQVKGPVRDGLKRHYGYADLAELDPDFRSWLEHRARESARQERGRKRELDANFECTSKLESEHFALFTTCDEKTARPLLELAENVYEAFAREFWSAGILMPGRLKIYLFDTKEEYSGYLRSLGLELEFGKHLLPHYNSRSGAACTYRKGLSKDHLYQAIAHEVAHGLSGQLNQVAKRSWVREAIAYYFGCSVHAKTTNLALGQCYETKESQLASFVRIKARTEDLIALKDIHAPPEADAKTIVARRAQGWALFRFLMTSSEGRYREAFHAHLKELVETGRGGVAEFEKHIGPISRLEPVFEAWASRLRSASRSR